MKKDFFKEFAEWSEKHDCHFRDPRTGLRKGDPSETFIYSPHLKKYTEVICCCGEVLHLEEDENEFE